MLLNLINNVYIKNTVQARSTQVVIDEEEEGSENSGRPFGFVDSQGRFMVSSQAEVDKVYQRFYPLMVNKRMNHQKKQKLRNVAQTQANAEKQFRGQNAQVVGGETQYRFYRPPP